MADLAACPVEGCETKHPRNLLMCKKHWFRVPKDLRDEVWRAYREHGVISEEYLDSRAAAIEAAENG